MDDRRAGVVRGTVDGTISEDGNGLDEDPGIISAAPGKFMLAPTLSLENSMSAAASAKPGDVDNDNDSSTALTALVTSKIELIQQRINKARVTAGSQYAVIENAIEFATDLRSQYALGSDILGQINFSLEAAHLTKKQIMEDAAAAILSQANKSQEGLLMLV